jgi:glucose/arabinose dehydrogenase
MMRVAAVLSLLLLSLPADSQQVSFTPIATGFQWATDMRQAPGDTTFFVSEQAGRIQVVAAGGPREVPMLDISDRVFNLGEVGFLSFAFDPQWPTQPYVYARYVRENPAGPAAFRSVVSRFTVDPVALTASPASEVVILETDQPTAGHGGGSIAFGGNDYLFVALGDGALPASAQETNNLLGSILRLDVRGGGNPLDCGQGTGTVPAGNPLVDGPGGACDEIWAYGFRNPWRMTYDPITFALWVGDVGQDTWEEVNTVHGGGGNYGWPIMEGPQCLEAGCDTSGLIVPQYSYGLPTGQAITGGFRYWRSGPLHGRYIFGDWVTGRVWALNGTDAVQIASLPEVEVSSFGIDSDGDLYAVMLLNGIHRMDGATTSTGPLPSAPSLGLAIVGTHPFGNTGGIAVTVPGGGAVRVSLHDALGRLVGVLFEGSLEPSTTRFVPIGVGRLAPGVYIARLTAAEGSRSLRLVVAR